MSTTASRLPVTLFTGQWADLPFEDVARYAAEWGYDGLEIAASGDHLDLKRADEDPAYLRSRLEVLERHGLKVYAISNHLTGQAVCDDPIDFRHQALVRPYTWGDGDGEGVRQRAAEDMKRAARVARKLDVDVVRALEAIGHRAAFGFNWDPSHMMWQNIDPVGFIVDFADRIYHVDCKDTRMRQANGRAGVLGSHLAWGDPRRGWDFVSTGHGDVPWEDAFRALQSIGYAGPISVEWEDAGMDRLHGAAEAVGYIRSLLWKVPETRFDAAFSSQE